MIIDTLIEMLADAIRSEPGKSKKTKNPATKTTGDYVFADLWDDNQLRDFSIVADVIWEDDHTVTEVEWPPLMKTNDPEIYICEWRPQKPGFIINTWLREPTAPDRLVPVLKDLHQRFKPGDVVRHRQKLTLFRNMKGDKDG